MAGRVRRRRGVQHRPLSSHLEAARLCLWFYLWLLAASLCQRVAYNIFSLEKIQGSSKGVRVGLEWKQVKGGWEA